MTTVTAQIRVAEDRTISGIAPTTVPPGEHEAVISVAPARQLGKPFTMENFPSRDLGWDGSISLRRKDMYGDDGR
jgi:hypothetical protein